MNHFEKFLRRQQPKIQRRIIGAVDQFLNGRWDDLDLKPLSGKRNTYRCRIGDIRIVFTKNEMGSWIVVDADYRDKIYKRG